jgi:hypothetical protein
MKTGRAKMEARLKRRAEKPKDYQATKPDAEESKEVPVAELPKAVAEESKEVPVAELPKAVAENLEDLDG